MVIVHATFDHIYLDSRVLMWVSFIGSRRLVDVEADHPPNRHNFPFWCSSFGRSFVLSFEMLSLLSGSGKTRLLAPSIALWACLVQACADQPDLLGASQECNRWRNKSCLLRALASWLQLPGQHASCRHARVYCSCTLYSMRGLIR